MPPAGRNRGRRGKDRGSKAGHRAPLGRSVRKHQPAAKSGPVPLEIRPERQGAGLVPNIDAAMASIEKAFQSLIPHQQNSTIIEEAKRLNAKLFAPASEVGPLQKSAIAETLLLMFAEIDKRVKNAPTDKMYRPILEGVKWKDDDPIGYITESIDPFGMVDWWHGFLVRAKPDAPRSQASKKKGSTAPPKKPAKPPPPPPEERRKLTVPETIKRVKQGIRRVDVDKVPDMGTRRRWDCIISKLENPSANHWYMDAPGIRYLIYRHSMLHTAALRRIRNDTLTTKEKQRLTAFDPNWRENISSPYKSKGRKALHAVKLATYLIRPQFMKYWNERSPQWSKDARKFLQWYLNSAGSSDRSVAAACRRLNMNVMSLFSYFKKWEARGTLGGGGSEHIVLRLVRARVNALQNNPKAFLYCFTHFGK